MGRNHFQTSEAYNDFGYKIPEGLLGLLSSGCESAFLL